MVSAVRGEEGGAPDLRLVAQIQAVDLDQEFGKQTENISHGRLCAVSGKSRTP